MIRLLRISQEGKDGPNRFPNDFGLAIDPRIIITKILSEGCSIFTSKKKPVNLKMEKKNGNEQIRVIFKTGDDLRMDMLAI